MALFNTLPENPRLADVWRKFPHGVDLLVEHHDLVLRGESPLTVAERELIAAYVSGNNSCQFCHGAHRMIAESHGIDPQIFDHLFTHPENSGVDKKMLPILAYVKKLTLTPNKMVDADAEAVYQAGWDERALYDAVVVCAMFNFMNRIVEGTGCVPQSEEYTEQRRHMYKAQLENKHFYRELGKQAVEAK